MGRPLGRESWQAPPIGRSSRRTQTEGIDAQTPLAPRGSGAAILAVATSATATTKVAGSAQAADATPAAAPFAQAWANVPRSQAARKAKDVLVFGQEQDIVGFN